MTLIKAIKLTAVALSGFAIMSFDDKQPQGSPCTILKSGSFKIGDIQDTTSYIVFTSSSQTEYYNFKRYWIRSSIKWVSDCEYELTVLSVNYPGLLCRRGDKMSIRIINVDGNTINYEALIDGRRERGRYLKTENSAP